MPPKLTVERPPSLAATVARTLEEAIVNGQFAPGMPIIESRVCEEINVSRGTLREALRLLQDRGLVQMITHRGAIVSELTSRSAYEIYSLRMVLEPYAIRLSMEQNAYTQPVLDNLRSIISRMFDLADTGDLLGLIEADMEFHRVLCYHCNHEMLLSTLDGLRQQMRRFMIFTKIHRSDLQSEAITHQPIYDAVAENDVTKAEEVLRDHIRLAGEALVQKVNVMKVSATSGT
jgi:DNA-binding GntR family transcriptional regulator